MKFKDFGGGLNANLTNPHFIKWSKAFMNITTVFSSSFYPKFIYGVPLLEKLCKNRLKLEFKFKFELNWKRNKKRKEQKRGGAGHVGWFRPKRPSSTPRSSRGARGPTPPLGPATPHGPTETSPLAS